MDLPALSVDIEQVAERQTIADHVERVIRHKTGGVIRALRVEILPGQVIVSGRANTYYLKQLVTHAALEVIENVELVNSIEVC